MNRGPTIKNRNLIALLSATVVVLGVAACTAPAAVDKATHTFDSSLGAAQLGEEDGYVADSISLAVDDDVPAVTKLTPSFRTALTAAAKDAARNRIDLRIVSGWRAERLQEYLFENAVRSTGSRQEARKTVSLPGTSEHQHGRAVDVSGANAIQWMSQHGNRYGLCQIYRNEPWHYELATRPAGACPTKIANAAG